MTRSTSDDSSFASTLGERISEGGQGLMSWFSTLVPENSASTARSSVQHGAWADDVWARIADIQAAEEGRLREDAIHLFITGLNGEPYLLRPAIAQALAKDEELKGEYDALNTLCQEAGLDTNQIANLRFANNSFGIDTAEAFIDEIAALNSITHHTGLSIMVQQTGGLSRVASGEGENATPAFTGLQDHILATMKAETGNPDLTLEDLNPEQPAHMALIHRVLEEQGQTHVLQAYLANNSNGWSSHVQAEAIRDMEQAGLKTPNLIAHWNEATPAPDDSHTPEATTPPVRPIFST